MTLQVRLKRLERALAVQTSHHAPLIVILHDIEPGQETFDESFSGGLIQVRYARTNPDESLDPASESIV